jgi:hypothetical protein
VGIENLLEVMELVLFSHITFRYILTYLENNKTRGRPLVTPKELFKLLEGVREIIFSTPYFGSRTTQSISLQSQSLCPDIMKNKHPSNSIV